AYRDMAEARCALKDWARCKWGLDEAAMLDPAGESEPRVQKARAEIAVGGARPGGRGGAEGAEGARGDRGRGRGASGGRGARAVGAAGSDRESDARCDDQRGRPCSTSGTGDLRDGH